MRIIKDGLGNVYRDGETLHTGVRVMQDSTGRVAVFVGKTRTPPIAVYPSGEVTFDRSGGCSTCKGWPAQASMKVIWERHDRQVVDAV